MTAQGLILLPDTDPMLHRVMPVFTFDGSVDPVELTDAMWACQKEHDAVGLAANQVGLEHRVFVMGLDEKIVCFNPEVIEQHDPRVGMEGCLTYPGLALDVSRPFTILARYQDASGTVVERSFEGLLARCFCHETDHVNGITFTSKVSRLKLDMAKKKMKKR